MFNNINFNSRRAAAGVVALLLLIVTFATLSVVGGDEPPAEGAPPAANCDDVTGTIPTLFNQQTEDLAFGPAVTPELDAALAELHARRCLDPALTAAHAVDYGLEGFPFPSTDEEWQTMWSNLNADRALWLSVIGQMEAKEKEAVAEIVDYPEAYHTMWFLDGPETVYGKLPYLRQGPGHAAEAGMVLRFTWSDGTVKMFRLSCGFQPVSPVPYPNIPPVEQPPCVCPPPTGTVPPGTVPPGCEHCPPPTTPPTTVPPTTQPPCEDCPPPTTVKPPTDFNCQQNNIGCPPGVTNDVVQPPQDNSTSGIDVGPTRDGNGTPVPEPPLQPTTPVDNRTTPAPAPNPTPIGSNSGSPTGSGTPSGSYTPPSGPTVVGPNITNPPVNSGQGGNNNAPIAPPPD
jgi:hypothetical protein